MIKVDNRNISKILVDRKNIGRVMIGGKMIWPYKPYAYSVICYYTGTGLSRQAFSELGLMIGGDSRVDTVWLDFKTYTTNVIKNSFGLTGSPNKFPYMPVYNNGLMLDVSSIFIANDTLDFGRLNNDNESFNSLPYGYNHHGIEYGMCRAFTQIPSTIPAEQTYFRYNGQNIYPYGRFYFSNNLSIRNIYPAIRLTWWSENESLINSIRGITYIASVNTNGYVHNHRSYNEGTTTALRWINCRVEDDDKWMKSYGGKGNIGWIKATKANNTNALNETNENDLITDSGFNKNYNYTNALNYGRVKIYRDGTITDGFI